MSSSDRRHLAATLREIALYVVRSAPQHELSRTAASTLSRVQRGGPMRITTLAELESVSQPSMTGLVQRLESLGYLSRSADPDDRRATRMAITPAGVCAVEARRATHEAVIAERLADLSTEDLDALSAALPALSHLIEKQEHHVHA